MKKIRLLFISILIIMSCTGCNVEYNIKITKDNIQETINVIDYESTVRTKNDIIKQYNKWYPTYVNYMSSDTSIKIENFNKKYEGIEYHNKNIIEVNNGYKYTYNYNYSINKYYDASTLANSFKDTTVLKKNNSLVLKTSKESFLCKYKYFENAKINITIDEEIYKLNYTNAESRNKNTYTWNINKNNCNNNEIILTLEVINDSSSTENQINNNIKNDSNKKINNIDNYILYIFLAILALIIYFGYKWFINMKDKNNDID